MDNKKKNKKIIGIMGVIGVILVATVILLLEKEIPGIKKFEIETSSGGGIAYLENPDGNDYYEVYIDSPEELKKFESLFDVDDVPEVKNAIRSYDLNEYGIFIHVESVGSPSTKLKLKNVKISNNTVKLIVRKNWFQNPFKVYLAVSECWFLIAVVPNEKLETLDLSNWTKPSSVGVKQYYNENDVFPH